MEIPTHPVREVARVFVRLGLTAFGGPIAHIAAMEDEFVRRRGWISRSEFLDLVSAANVIPGPNSTELAIHLGNRRAGWRGLIVAGAGFILPATAMVWLLAMAYVKYGRRPETAAVLSGMQPVILAVVVQAVWRLLRSVWSSPLQLTALVLCAASLALGAHELLVLATGAVVGFIVRSMTRARRDAANTAQNTPSEGSRTALVPVAPTTALTVTATSIAMATPVTAGSVLFAFLKIGSVLFGSGYVLLAFLRAEFVERQHWLTNAQLLDAIAIGQITPGPVFTSATFVGYLLAGHAGAAAATVGIFLPAFCFVAVSGPIVRRVRASATASAALDGVNAASLALMIGVLALMVPPVASSVTGVAIFLGASLVLLRSTIGAGWMLLAGAVVGALHLLLSSPSVS